MRYVDIEIGSDYIYRMFIEGNSPLNGYKLPNEYSMSSAWVFIKDFILPSYVKSTRIEWLHAKAQRMFLEYDIRTKN